MTNGPSSGAARVAEGSAAIVSSAVLVNSSELTFKRMDRRGFIVVQAPLGAFVPNNGKCVESRAARVALLL